MSVKARFSQASSGLRRAIARSFRALPSALCDLVGFAGAGSVSYGSWLIYRPAGFLVAGVLLMAFAMFVGRRFETGKPG